MKSKLSNILDAIKLQRDMLLKTGCWPVRNPSFGYRCKYYLAWTIDLSFQIFLFSELYKNFTQGEYKAMTELLSFMASEVPYLFKHLLFDLNKNRFMTALDKLNHPMFNEYPKVCDKYVQTTIKVARFIMRFYQFTVINLVLLYLFKPIFSEQMAIRFSVIDLGRYKWVFHIYQVISIGSGCYNNSTFDILALGIMSIASAQFEILRDKLINITKWAGLKNEEIDNGGVNDDVEINDVSDTVFNQYLSECVKHHLGILEYVSDIEYTYTYYVLVQFVDSVLAICNTWFQFMVHIKSKYWK